MPEPGTRVGDVQVNQNFVIGLDGEEPWVVGGLGRGTLGWPEHGLV